MGADDQGVVTGMDESGRVGIEYGFGCLLDEQRVATRAPADRFDVSPPRGEDAATVS